MTNKDIFRPTRDEIRQFIKQGKIIHTNPDQYPWLNANQKIIVDVIDRINNGWFGSIKEIDWAKPAFRLTLDKPDKWRMINLKWNIYGRQPAKLQIRVLGVQKTIFASYPPEEQSIIAGEDE